MKSRLEIDGNSVGFMDELPISHNMAVADIREPDKRNSAFSKTIQIPGDPEVNALFEYIFNVNSVGNNFNPNIKTPAKYFINEVEVFSGSLQLLKIKKKAEATTIQNIYECSIIGDSGNLFLALAGLYLTDIDFSDLNHSFTITSPALSDPKFNPPIMGSGYVYPYIDYGTYFLGTPRDQIWDFESLKPAIFEKEYLTRIFANAGYSWTNQSYFNSVHEGRIVIPDVNEGPLQLPSAAITANQFRAGLSANSNQTTAGLNVLNSWLYFASDRLGLPLNNDSTAPNFDPGGNYNTGTFIFTAGISAWFELTAIVNLNITITPPATTTSFAAVVSGNLCIEKSTNGGVTWSIANGGASNSFGASIQGTTSAVTVQIGATVTSTNFLQLAGTQFRVSLKGQQGSAAFLNGVSPVTSGSSSVQIEVVGGVPTTVNNASTFWGLIKRGDLPYGSTVVMNTTIPQNITQLDFLTSIIKAENLYMELDKQDKTVYHIHAREDFIDLTTPLDWTYKQDLSKEIEITPMGELNYKQYLFTYKKDEDYYNKDYYDRFKEVYGQYLYEVDNDFLRDEKKIELCFSPTPVASGWFTHSMVTPRFFAVETLSTGQAQVKPIKCNIRRLAYGILQGTQLYNSLQFNTNQELLFGYPYAGDVFNPYVPQIDLNFGPPKILYWSFPGQQYTTANRFNERYSKYMYEITNRDSKIVTSYFNLTENDIATFSFRKIVFVQDAYYLVNKIIDYNPLERQTTKVELLKLKTGALFVASQADSDPVDVGGNGSGSSNRTVSGGANVGYDNFNGGIASFIAGTGNTVGRGASNITLLSSSGVAVDSDVINFFGVGLTDEDIDSSYSNRGKVKLLTEIPIVKRILEVAADFTVSQDVDEYRVNASGSNVIAGLNSIEVEQTFYKTDVTANYVRVKPDGSYLINGQPYLDITTQYDCLTVTFDGTEYLAK